MTISERARVREMPERERPISEQFRVVAKQWADANAAAKLLEETKQSVLSKLILQRREESISAFDKDTGRKKEWTAASSFSAAEHVARASDEYQEHIRLMCEARAKADLLRVQMKYIEMLYGEWQSSDANARRERQMGRQAT